MHMHNHLIEPMLWHVQPPIHGINLRQIFMKERRRMEEKRKRRRGKKKKKREGARQVAQPSHKAAAREESHLGVVLAVEFGFFRRLPTSRTKCGVLAKQFINTLHCKMYCKLDVKKITWTTIPF